jgi:3-isopropylmalate/(R)-2-methylmalate dehydratase small subunit
MNEFETHAFVPPEMTAHGRAWKFGDFVDVEEMCMTRFFALPPDKLRQHVFEKLRPDFGQGVQPGDLVVGGRAFGCGHGHDHANVALKTTGVAGIIAASFGSQFYRHAVDHAMPLITSPEAAAGIEEAHEVEADFDTGEVLNLTTGERWQGTPMRGLAMEILKMGGLVPYVRGLVHV